MFVLGFFDFLLIWPGYADIGETWKEQLDIPDVVQLTEKLLAEISPFYRLLHGYVRHKLRAFYGRDRVGRTTPIPAHLLGQWNITIKENDAC